MKNHKYTIIIPEFAHPNYLAVCLRGLLKYSSLNPKIIIVGSDIRRYQVEEWKKDFIVDPDTKQKYRKYEYLQDFINRNKQLLKENDITYIDCTEEAIEFMERYKRGEIFKGKTEPQGGVDIAFKNNFAMKFVDTEFVIPNWDDDFFPAPNWDENLFYFAEMDCYRGKFVFSPTHVQPIASMKGTERFNPWSDYRHIACNVLPIPSQMSQNALFTREADWIRFARQWGFPYTYTESCGQRDRCHYLPTLYGTDGFRKYIREYSYMGSGYDIEIDNRLGELSFTKISPRDSFILHKGNIPFWRDEI